MTTGETQGTVARVVRLLQCLAEGPEEISVKELSEQLALAPSTVHRLLHLLMPYGLVERGAARHRYRAGLEYFRLGQLVVSRTSVKDVAQPFLHAIVEACDETTVLLLYLPATRRVMVADVVHAPRPLRYDLQLYQPMTPAWAATGRSILAFLPPDEIELILAEGDPSPADGRPLPPREEVLAELERIRAQGYVRSCGQRIPGAVGLAAPVFGADGGVLGSLCATIPDTRFKPADEPDLARVVMAEATRLSQALGWRPAARRAAGR